ncbi:hypothetical protein Aduo_004631 [Ancylostoma duodenale]
MCVALILLMNAFYKVYYWLFDLCEHALVSALLLATVFFFFLPVLFNLESAIFIFLKVAALASDAQLDEEAC